MKKSAKNKKNAFNAVFRSTQLVFRSSPLAFFGKILIALSTGVFGSLLTPANSYLFSSAEQAAQGNGEASKVILGAVLVIGVMMASNLLSAFIDTVSLRIDQKLVLGVTRFFYLKVGLVPPIRYEESAFIQTMEKASGSANAVIGLVDD